MSSGHKRIVFSRSDPALYAQTLDEARRLKTPSWLMQEEVEQRRVPVVVFDEHGNRHVREYYLRLTMMAAEKGMLGLIATGREQSFAHGAPDCMQIPAIRA